MKFIELLMKSELNNVQVLERTNIGSERVIKFSNPFWELRVYLDKE